MPTAPPALTADTSALEWSLDHRFPALGPKPCGDHRRHIARILQRVLGASYRDPLFERPDLVEDDYYRFINQPRG